MEKPKREEERPNLAQFRMFQQLRLWLYLAMLVSAGMIIWYGDRDKHVIAFFVGLSSMILLGLETCPQCKRPVWREGQRFWSWGGVYRAFWIGLECREPPLDQSSR